MGKTLGRVLSIGAAIGVTFVPGRRIDPHSKPSKLSIRDRFAAWAWAHGYRQDQTPEHRSR
jgi:hypothetical protein